MATNISHSPADTFALGEAWGRKVQPGRVIGLCGDLGAGKTQLVKGLSRGLGIEARVQSPTFSLVNIYRGGRLTLFHLDLYRLDTREQIIAAGLEDYLAPAGVAIIEWAERWFTPQHANPNPDPEPEPSKTPHQVPGSNSSSPEIFWVSLEILGESHRRISYEDPGP
jgi:tRNA threonylcarbamoyladenosine biosynthesis protein TsaE